MVEVRIVSHHHDLIISQYHRVSLRRLHCPNFECVLSHWQHRGAGGGGRGAGAWGLGENMDIIRGTATNIPSAGCALSAICSLPACTNLGVKIRKLPWRSFIYTPLPTLIFFSFTNSSLTSHGSSFHKLIVFSLNFHVFPLTRPSSKRVGKHF